KITSSSDVFEVMKPALLDETIEHFYAVFLNRANVVIKKQVISQGDISATVVDHKIDFKHAMENMASDIIHVHNHPSGNLKPSQADIQLTRKMVEAGKNLELLVLDHVIFTDVGYFSFADESMI